MAGTQVTRGHARRLTLALYGFAMLVAVGTALAAPAGGGHRHAVAAAVVAAMLASVYLFTRMQPGGAAVAAAGGFLLLSAPGIDGAAGFHPQMLALPLLLLGAVIQTSERILTPRNGLLAGAAAGAAALLTRQAHWLALGFLVPPVLRTLRAAAPDRPRTRMVTVASAAGLAVPAALGAMLPYSMTAAAWPAPTRPWPDVPYAVAVAWVPLALGLAWAARTMWRFVRYGEERARGDPLVAVLALVAAVTGAAGGLDAAAASGMAACWITAGTVRAVLWLVEERFASAAVQHWHWTFTACLALLILPSRAPAATLTLVLWSALGWLWWRDYHASALTRSGEVHGVRLLLILACVGAGVSTFRAVDRLYHGAAHSVHAPAGTHGLGNP